MKLAQMAVVSLRYSSVHFVWNRIRTHTTYLQHLTPHQNTDYSLQNNHVLRRDNYERDCSNMAVQTCGY